MPAREVDLKLVGGRVVTGGGVLQAGVAVDGGTIVAVARDDLLPDARRTIDVRGNHILPGIVDSEAHPGCYVPFEGDLGPEGRAAACAGVTTWASRPPARAPSRSSCRRRTWSRSRGRSRRPGRRSSGCPRRPSASGTAAPASPRVETFLPVMLTHGVHEGRITLERLVQVCCENPARIYGLFPRKGTVAVGSDADLVVIDLSREVTVGPEHLNTRAGRSIMEDKTYHGWPVLTLLGGRVVAEWAAGWGRPAGLGRRPVLLIDVDYNFVVDRPGRVLERARARRLPVLYTTSPRRPDGFDLCVWNLKSWRAGDGTDVQGHLGNEIVAEVAPHPGDLLVERKPSAFLGTPLVSYLVALPADTVLLCGTTTSGCVRASAVDPSSYDFRVGIPEPCVWDRGELTHAELPGLREGGSAAR